MDEGQSLRVSIAKALSICSQSTRIAERHCWSMDTLCDSRKGRREGDSAALHLTKA